MTGCLVTIHTRYDTPADSDLGDFLAENELASEELIAMFAKFGQQATYFGGGGAAPEWAIALSKPAA